MCGGEGRELWKNVEMCELVVAVREKDRGRGLF
jgi:hypothetical protein